MPAQAKTHAAIVSIPRLAACSLLVAAAAAAQPVSPDADNSPARATLPINNNAADRQPENEGLADPEVLAAQDQPEDLGDSVIFEAFTEPVELATLVDYVGATLGINIIIKGTLNGTVTFNAPVAVPKDDLLELLDAVLEQYGFAITQDASGIYTVQPKAETPVNFLTGRATSKIIDTQGLRPSGLESAMRTVLGLDAGQGNIKGVAFVDELGVIVMTGTPRDIARVEEVIASLQMIEIDNRFSRIELDHIAAPVARERVIQLVGGASGSTGGVNANIPNRGQQPGQQTPAVGSTGNSLDNIAGRLTVDAQSNALIFRGNDLELQRLLDVITVIDVPNRLESKSYFVGSAVGSVADLARQRGLGEVIELQDTSSGQNTPFNFGGFNNQNQQNLNNQNQPITGGPIMIVDPVRQTIIYNGTPAQQQELASWIELLDVSDDIVTLEYYKLSNARAVDVAEIIQGLITGRSQTGDSALLPNSNNFGGFNQFGQPVVQQNTDVDGEGFAPDPNRVFVIADEANNQVIVKAPKKQQNEFERLVGRLDLRRPQVYIEATIVAVTDTRDFRLAVETQLAAGQFQAQNLFGLSDPGATFQDPRAVASGLPGFTSALIRSDMVPFIITAVRTDTDSRILSSPQLLVNDNEEATIASIDQQPTTTSTQGNATTEVAFSGFEDAGTTLTVTPTISEAGYIRLEYVVELSNFVGVGSNGIPAPRQQRNVDGIATIPSDATIVVGGIEVDDINNTIIRVPLLGDLPLVGHLFRDTNKSKSKTLLYIFITPRIMTDPTFQDLRLLTRGPQSEAELDPMLPKLKPNRIEMAPSRRQTPPEPETTPDETPIIEERP